jgi:radical SAM protein with 4Fe4S-binding SPASM domain
VFIEEMIQVGVPAVRFTPIFAHGRGGENSDLLLSNEELKSLLEFIAVQREVEDRIAVTLSEEGYYGPEWECRIRDSLHYCGSGITVGTILHDGRVTGCPSVSRELVEGSLHEDSFLDLWHGAFKPYRHNRKELFGQQCGSCEHWILCEGGGCHLLKQKVEAGHCQYKKIKDLT